MSAIVIKVRKGYVTDARGQRGGVKYEARDSQKGVCRLTDATSRVHYGHCPCVTSKYRSYRDFRVLTNFGTFPEVWWYTPSKVGALYEDIENS